MAAEDVHLICEALKTNVVMVQLLLSEHLIGLGRRESALSRLRCLLEGGLVFDGNGNLISVPEQAPASSLEKLAHYRNGIARCDLANSSFEIPARRYLSLASIAFLLPRNVGLQNGVPTSDDFMPDKAFMEAVAILPDPE